MELRRCDLLLRPHIDFPSPVLDCIGSIVHQQSLLLDEYKCDIRPPFPRGTRRVRTLSPDKIWRSRAASKSSKKDSQVKQFPCFFLRTIWSFSFFMINYNSVNILLYVYVNISIYIYTHIVEAWLSPSSIIPIIPIDPGWPGPGLAWNPDCRRGIAAPPCASPRVGTSNIHCPVQDCLENGWKWTLKASRPGFFLIDCIQE